MGVHRNMIDATKSMKAKLKAETIESDKEKMYYLYFDRLFSITEIESFFNGKHSYNEIRTIIKDYYKEYYEKEKINGR